MINNQNLISNSNNQNIVYNNKFTDIISRVEHIQNIIDNTIFDPMLNFNNLNNFIINNNKNISSLIKKKNINYNDIIDLFGNNLEYIKSGSTGHTFKGSYKILNNEDNDINNNNNNNNIIINYAVKIVPYVKKDIYGDEYSSTRPENSELLILNNLSFFVMNNITPHIILPITTFYTQIDFLKQLLKNTDNEKCKNYLKELKNKNYYENISILVSEWANGGDLLDYLRKNYTILKVKEWRIILFQIISTIAIIQTKYPNFKHNDLKANNLLVYNLEITDKNKYFVYKINNQKYIIPNIGIQIKLWDFDFACISDVIENDKVNSKWANDMNINHNRNRYYDIHFFFNTLTRKGFLPDFFENKNISNVVKQFIKRIVPDKLNKGENVSEKGRLLKNIEYTTPNDIIQNDDFFKKMRYNDD